MLCLIGSNMVVLSVNLIRGD